MPSTLDFEIPELVYQLSDGSSFVLYDSYADENSQLNQQEDRIILFGIGSTLHELETADDWASDGTFSKVPANFRQLYSIHFRIGQSFRPGVFALMTKKSAEMYKLMLAKLSELIPNAAPKRIFLDYEAAAIQAYTHQYGGNLSSLYLSIITFNLDDLKFCGCFFHFSQAVYRHIASNNLAVRYRTDPEFSLFCRFLPSLAFLPLDKVVESFGIVCLKINSKFGNLLAPVLEYFERTFIGIVVGGVRR